MYQIAMKRIKRLLTNCGRHLFFVVRVSGESMWPALVPGKRYLATNVLRPKVGDMIVFRDRNNPEHVFVKRVRVVCPEGYEVESAVTWGVSSNELGLISHDLVRGRILF
jgi:phage repressor protein C with HTH and peptisase S24 domain